LAILQPDWSFDFGRESLDETCALVDARVASLLDLLRERPESGHLDLPEVIEYLIGLGFAACQGYTTGVCAETGVSRQQALDLGLHHSSGPTIAALVNHAANWWKHCDEWSDPPDTSAQQTIEGLAALGIS
jgi:hypothetical protein